jgi:DNA-binding transcriptional ArsR family regulator
MPSYARERFGKRLFGRPARLELGLYFVEHSQSFLAEVCDEIGLPQSAVLQELRAFVDLGLLYRTELEGSRRVYYQRSDSAWWGVFEAAMKADEDARAAPRDGERA